MIPKDPLKNVLVIDLSKKTFEKQERIDLFDQYLGGTGVGIQLLHEFAKPTVDPLGLENAIILATGPLVGAFPMASKTVAMFKSPLTGNLGESHAGGRSSVAIRSAGYGAIVITGKSELPVYVVVDENSVYFRDARALWGLPSSRQPRWAIAKREPNAGCRTILVTGPAGERMVRYASVVSESFRHFGRLGLGAVFGSKNLKALQIGGKRAVNVQNAGEYRKIYKSLYDRCLEPEFVAKYRQLGTPENLLPLNEIGALPTRNLTQAKFEAAETISGEHFQHHFLARRVACSHCPVACVHLAELREPYAQESYFNKTTLVSYDYELIYALGTMLGVGDPEQLLRLLIAVEDLGVDAISCGVSLAWATEAFQKGFITQKETLVSLKWGDATAY